MSVLAFVLGLVRALAWPALVSLVIIVLRHPIREMLGEITRSAKRMRAKAGPVELELERLVVQSVEELKEVDAKPIASYSPIIRPPAAFRLNYLLVKNPTAAITEGYAEIEGRLRALLGNASIKVSGLADLPILSRQACDHELVPVQVVTMADSLSVARARIAETDGHSISGTTAYAFMSMYDILDYMIEAYKPGPRN
jgi:hypothetical protein